MTVHHNPAIAYRPEIDGLRALAVVPVILFHAGFETFSGGFVGVDIFFVISGYLITSILIKELTHEKYSIIRFYERRARRILPALFFMMLTTLPFAWFLMLPYQLVDFGQSIVSTLLFFSNILFWQESDYFGASAELKPLLHTWSLSVEEQFYLLFPPALALVFKLKRSLIKPLLLLSIVLSLALAEWGWRNASVANFYLLPTRAWELAIGAFLAITSQSNPRQFFKHQDTIGLLLIVYAIFNFDKVTPFPSLHALVPVLGTALILQTDSSQACLARRILTQRFIVEIGLVSYSLYLFHQPVFAFARLAGHNSHDLFTFFPLMALTAGLAVFSYRHIETPFRKNSTGKSESRTLKMPSSTVSIAFITSTTLLSAGLICIVKEGFITRFPEHDRMLVSLNISEEGRRVRETYWTSLQGKAFSADSPKVLLIGDSFSQDFVNAVIPHTNQGRVNISAHHIRSYCGNLAVPAISFEEHIPLTKRTECKREGWYEKADLRTRIEQADVIVLASMWPAWSVPYLPESLDRIREISKKQIKIFIVGTKNFGTIDPLAIAKVPTHQRGALASTWPEEGIKINEAMKALAIPNFIDYSSLLCGGSYVCPVFTSTGRLVSFDGLHFTVEGAQEVGKLILKVNPELAIALSSKLQTNGN